MQVRLSHVQAGPLGMQNIIRLARIFKAKVSEYSSYVFFMYIYHCCRPLGRIRHFEKDARCFARNWRHPSPIVVYFVCWDISFSMGTGALKNLVPFWKYSTKKECSANFCRVAPPQRLQMYFMVWIVQLDMFHINIQIKANSTQEFSFLRPSTERSPLTRS